MNDDHFLLFIPLFLQGGLILIDEFYFHFRRELPRWERIGHPIDTISLAICVAICVLFPLTYATVFIYGVLSVVSCLMVTKDEWVHPKYCTAGEMWIHSMLFILHPLVLLSIGLIWVYPTWAWVVKTELVLLVAYALYQVIYWNFLASSRNINNKFYDDLGDQWYHADDHPIALLRAESKLFEEWIDAELKIRLNPVTAHILDVGCGAGLVSNALAKRGWKLTAVDLSEESLDIARRFDETKSVNYIKMDAENVSFDSSIFDAVISLDMLEHVENPAGVIKECSRILKQDGIFFFHTFNRTWMGWLFAIKAIDWFVKSAPEHLHIYRLFITDQEFRSYCQSANLQILEMKGVSPILTRKNLFVLIFQGRIAKDFGFRFTKNINIGYAGVAIKA